MRWLFVVGALGAFFLPATPVGSQVDPEPGRVVVVGAAGVPAGAAKVTVLRPAAQQVSMAGGVTPASSVQGASPIEAILLRTETTSEGVVKDALPRLRGLTLMVDHPAHLPFIGVYPNEAPPGVIRLRPGRMAKGAVLEADGGEPVVGARVCAFWRDAGLLASFGPRTVRRALSTQRDLDAG